jgi:hypothetical protein
MRIAAYIMAGDPAWLRSSVESYYDLVDQLYVSYDEGGLSWTGQPLPVQRCLDLVREVDRARKVVYLPGTFWRPDAAPMDNDTHQRQVTLNAAAEDADWVVQLDTDEIVLDPDEFVRAIGTADANGRDGLEYPARCMYAALGDGRYLEQSSRFGRLAATYPGPVAVRTGTRLTVARQGPSPESLWRVDFRRQNTDPGHPAGARVDATVRPDQAIVHLSWVRSEADLRAKGGSSGHANDFNWSLAVAKWRWRQEHPVSTILTTPLRFGFGLRWFRLGRVAVPLAPGTDRRIGDGWSEQSGRR